VGHYLDAHVTILTFINLMTISSNYTRDYMLTTRYWVSMTILNMRKSNLPIELITRLGDVNVNIDKIVFNMNHGYSEWARSVSTND